ncbi:hypothetical protein KJ810_04310, partial [Patescibacteria group bacterium]|nr:hypothetical protein [Patescibacteria group bacterium]
MKEYVLTHEEYHVSPLTISPNHNGWPNRLLIGLLDGHKVGVRTFCEHEKQKLLFYVEFAAWDKGSDYLIGKIQTNPEFIEKVKKESEQLATVLLKLVRNTEKQDLSNWTNNQLATYLDKTYKLSNDFCAWGYVPVFSDHYFQKYSHLLKHIIKSAVVRKDVKLSVPETVNTLSSPIKTILSKKARIEFIKLVVGLKTKKVTEKHIINYYRKWNWVSFGQLGPRMTKEELVLSAKELLKNRKMAKEELAEMIGYSSTLIGKQNLLFKKLDLNNQEKYLFHVAQLFTYLKGLRMETLFGVCSQWQRVLTEMSKRVIVPRKLLYYCSKTELVDWLKKSKAINIKKLGEREKYCVWIAISEDRQEILTGKKAKEYVNKNARKVKQKIKQVLVIHGMVAATGYAKGKVRIVNESSEISKIQKGDILVSVATTPSLLPAMKKAAAFVTDAGGLTSHAAIVA